MENKNFVHLHFHSEYSLLDGACRIKDIPDALKSAGMDSLAITDHGVMFGCVDFYKTLKKNGIKPIIGCEIYVAPKSRFEKERINNKSYSHLVLLCKSELGYKNLIKIVSKAYTEGFYAKPRADIELLRQYHEGIIALSGCIGGEIPQKILDGDIDGARNTALIYKEIFGGDFYLEIQRHGLDEENIVNEHLLKMSKELDIPLVATNDVHYLEKSDARKQEILMCIQMGETLETSKNTGFEKQEFYLKNSSEMYTLFSDVPEALENTVKISQECNFDFNFDKTHLPAFFPPDNLTSKQYLEKKCKDGLERRLLEIKDKTGVQPDVKTYTDRLSYELSVVSKMGYDEYYLIVDDFISHAKNKGIPVGPGRGSGAGSLAAYCLGITDIDPIKYGLLFERFLNPERVSMPDFDVDFCYWRRGEVIDYVAEKYGQDHVAQIITFGTLAARAAVRDVGRVMGVSYSDVDRVAKCIPQALNMTIERALTESRELKEIYDTESTLKSVIDIARQIEGMPRNASTHAAGVVITKDTVDSYVPLSVNGDLVVTQYTMNDIADLGLLKIDFLGLRYLTVIHEAAKSAGISVSDIPLDDKETYALISKGKTEGVFQLESQGMRSLLSRMAPKNIEDLTIAISLYRPGPMDSIPKFLENRKNPDKVQYKSEKLKEILDVTNGCIVYQEQVMQIFRSLAGYSFGRADIVRRAMSKKKQSVMDEERQYFIYGKKDENGNFECIGAVNNGVSERAAIEIYDDMSTFAQYAFNKSHAAAYAHLAYFTAYLKCHYPTHYMASLLTSIQDRTDKVVEYIDVCKKLGIKVKGCNVNESFKNFSTDGKSITSGLYAVKNVGESFVKDIVNERQKGKFTSFEDFLSRMSKNDINKRMIESLIRAGALDGLGAKRSQLLSSFEDAIDTLVRRNRQNVEGQFDMFSVADVDEKVGELVINYPDIPEFSQNELLAMEKDMTGMYISGHPLDAFSKQATALKCDKISDINEAVSSQNAFKYKDRTNVTLLGLVSDKKEKVTRNDARMAFLTLEDTTAQIEVIVFANSYNENAHKLYKGAVIGIRGEISIKESRNDADGETKNEPKIILKSVFDVFDNEKYKEDANSTQGASVKINLSSLLGAENVHTNKAEKPKASKDFDLYVKVKNQESAEFSRFMALCDVYNYGKTELFVYFEDSKKLTKASGRHIFVSDTMFSLSKQILGDKNVVKKEKI